MIKKSQRVFALTSDLQQLRVAAEQQLNDAPIWPSCCTTAEMQARSNTVPPTSFSTYVDMVYTVVITYRQTPWVLRNSSESTTVSVWYLRAKSAR